MKHAALVLLLICHVAHAGTGDEPKSRDTAVMLSLAGSAIPAVMLYGGLKLGDETLTGAGLALSVVGPSLGQWYAGRALTLGMPVRALGAGLMWKVAADAEHQSDPFETFSEVLVLGTASIAALAVGAGIDVAMSPGAVDDYNLAISPVVVRGPSTQALGIGVAGAF